jgi:hypothetical protein
MGFLRRIRGADAAVPDWAGYMSGQEYAEFRRLTHGWLRANNLGFREVPGGIDIDLGTDAPCQVGLVNLAQVCHAIPQEAWPKEIESFFATLVQAMTSEQDPTLDEARSMVKVRIYPDDYASGNADMERQHIGRDLAPGMMAVLVLDYPDRIASLRSDLAESWGLSVDELFALGLANVRNQDRPGVQREELGNGGKISIVMGDSFFSATWVLMMDQFLAPQPRHGAVVAVPNRHVILFQPITDLSVIEGTQAIGRLAAELYREGPGSISPSMYWLRGGGFTILPTRAEGTRAYFEPPAEFVDVLNQLPPAPGS